MALILASASPRRQELLRTLGLAFTVKTADIDETMDPALGAEAEVARICRAKAMAVLPAAAEDDIVIAADTIVCVGDRILGKPHTEAEAAEMLLRCLGGKKRGAVSELAVRLERKKTTREDLAALLERCRAVCAAALLLPYGCQPEESDREIAAFLAKNLTKTQIMRTIELLQKYHGECTYNVGASHVLGALAVELEGIL